MRGDQCRVSVSVDWVEEGEVIKRGDKVATGVCGTGGRCEDVYDA